MRRFSQYIAEAFNLNTNFTWGSTPDSMDRQFGSDQNYEGEIAFFPIGNRDRLIKFTLSFFNYDKHQTSPTVEFYAEVFEDEIPENGVAKEYYDEHDYLWSLNGFQRPDLSSSTIKLLSHVMALCLEANRDNKYQAFEFSPHSDKVGEIYDRMFNNAQFNQVLNDAGYEIVRKDKQYTVRNNNGRRIPRIPNPFDRTERPNI